MKFVKKIWAMFLTAALTVGLFGGIGVDAKEITLQVPVISTKVINDGVAVKIIIKKTKDAEGFEVYASGNAISYADYKKVDDDSIMVADITKDGKAKRTVTIKSLPAGTYKIKVRSYNTKKFGTKTYSSFSKEKTAKIKEKANGYLSSYDFSKVKKGDIIKFGTYEQDGNFANGKEAIEWIVIEKTKKQILVVSKYVLDCLPYNKEYESITWEDCTLRKWLNDKFYTNAFNKTEKEMIKTTTVENYDNALTGAAGGNDTKDKVFQLSQLEMINKNFGFAEDYNTKDENRRCIATTFARTQGVYTDDLDNKNNKGEGFCGWWLRTPGSDNMFSYNACYVNMEGKVQTSGYHEGSLFYKININYGYGVRPALVISLKS